MRNSRSANLITVARSAPTFGLICSATVVVSPTGVMLLIVTHG
jgi:hypothetical protein